MTIQQYYKSKKRSNYKFKVPNNNKIFINNDKKAIKRGSDFLSPIVDDSSVYDELIDDKIDANNNNNKKKKSIDNSSDLSDSLEIQKEKNVDINEDINNDDNNKNKMNIYLSDDDPLFKTYETIKQNIQPSDIKIKQETVVNSFCHCKKLCGDKCFNRRSHIECNRHNCKLSLEQCTNRYFNKTNKCILKVAQTPGKGHGLFTLSYISKNSFIIEYIGEMIDDNECGKRFWHKKQLGEIHGHFYVLQINRDFLIDTEHKGNICRFINHSCDPNCEIQVWVVNNKTRVGLFSLKNIREDEELTINYRFTGFDNENWTCHCGASNCRGRFNDNSESLKQSIKPFVQNTFRTDKVDTRSPSSWTSFWSSKFPFLKKDISYVREHKLFIVGSYHRKGAKSQYYQRLNSILKYGSKQHQIAKSFLFHKIADYQKSQLYSSEDISDDKNDCVCRRCGCPGRLVLCDTCPHSFHLTCANLSKLPHGKWSCSDCRNQRKSFPYF